MWYTKRTDTESREGTDLRHSSGETGNGGVLRLLVFYSWSVRSKSLYADKADCSIVPTYESAVSSCRSPENGERSGNIYVLICSGSYKTESHWLSVSSHAPPKLWVPLLTPQNKRLKKNQFKSINLIPICLFLRALLEATLNLNALHFLVCFPRTAKLWSLTCKFLIYQTHDETGWITFRVLYFFQHSQTNMAASNDLSDRERGGLAHTGLRVYLRAQEGAPAGFIHRT